MLQLLRRTPQILTPTGHLAAYPRIEAPNIGLRKNRLAWFFPDGRIVPAAAVGIHDGRLMHALSASPNWADAVYDGALDIIADNVSRVDADTTEPTTYAEATSTYTVGNYTLTVGDGNGDWTIANGDTSGRKLTLEAQSGNNGTGTGAANFLGFTNGTDTLYGVVDGDGDTINSGSAWSITATNILEIRDAT